MEKFWCCVSFHRVAAQLYLPITYILHTYMHLSTYTVTLMRVGTPGDTFFLGTGLGHIVFAKEQVGRPHRVFDCILVQVHRAGDWYL